MAAPVSSSALCSDSFFEPCSCEENTRNSALAGAASWNIPPTPPAFSVKMGGEQEEKFSAFYSGLSLKKCTVPHVFGTRGGNQMVGKGGKREKGKQLLCKHVQGQPLASTCIFFSLSNSDISSLRMT